METPKATASKRKPKRGPKSNTPKGKRDRVAYLPPMKRDLLSGLHTALNLALPMPVTEVTTEKLKALDARCWEPGLTDQEFKQRYLDACVLKRWQGGSSDDVEAREIAAHTKLLESEVRCKETNSVFWGPEALDWSNARIPVHLLKVYKRARCIIGRILGQFDWDEFPLCVDFSPGATTEFPRRSSKVTNKWQHGSHITPKAMPYGEAFRRWCRAPGGDVDLPDSSHQWVGFDPVDSNVVFTVPKRFDTRRTAAKGTTWNTALQKAVGTMVRRRLQRAKDPLLLPNAQELHGLLAKLGSGTSLLVTGDLVGASDCVTVGHVSTFFPPLWCKPLLDLREEYGMMPDGTIVRWEKVGSMGNGYTFEVETLLFYGLVKACCGKDSVVSVYGDDLIYPQKYHELVTEAMSFCGFEFNREKTFSGSHPFRESCGAYFYRGTDVKPFYVEKLPQSIGEVISLHNDVVVWHGRGDPEGFWGDVVDRCRALVPKQYWGPLGVSGTLWAEWDEATPRYEPKKQCFSVLSVLQVVHLEDDDCYIGRYLSNLWKGIGRSDDESPPGLTGRSWGDLLTDGAELGYQAKADTRFRAVRRYVDRAQWVSLTAQNIERRARA